MAEKGVLNRFFTEKNVYGKEGNIQWRRCYQKTLQDGIYLDLRVRMKLSGKFHFVLIVRGEGGKFW